VLAAGHSLRKFRQWHQVETIKPSLNPGIVFSRTNAFGKADSVIASLPRTSSAALGWRRLTQNALILQSYALFQACRFKPNFSARAIRPVGFVSKALRFYQADRLIAVF
jgi:hypothetical protein